MKCKPFKFFILANYFRKKGQIFIPKKLRCVSKEQVHEEVKQNNYIETDGSSSEEYEPFDNEKNIYDNKKAQVIPNVTPCSEDYEECSNGLVLG